MISSAMARSSAAIGSARDTDSGSSPNRGLFRIAAAVLFGKSTGGGTTGIAFRDLADTKDRVSATVDSNGDRSATGSGGTQVSAPSGRRRPAGESPGNYTSRPRRSVHSVVAHPPRIGPIAMPAWPAYSGKFLVWPPKMNR